MAPGVISSDLNKNQILSRYRASKLTGLKKKLNIGRHYKNVRL